MRQRRATSRGVHHRSWNGFLKFEQDAGQSVIIGFEQTEAFGELANFGAAFFEQFGLFAFEACCSSLSALRRARNRWFLSRLTS